MTEAQIELARHALGLNIHSHRSYRNHFCAGLGHSDYEDWLEMVRAGMAVRRKVEGFGGDDLFHLTKIGAEAALRPGETLDPEDSFPT